MTAEVLIRLAGDLLVIASGRMHPQDDLPLASLVPDDNSRRAIMRTYATDEGKEAPPAMSDCRYAPAAPLMHWLGKRLRREAK